MNWAERLKCELRASTQGEDLDEGTMQWFNFQQRRIDRHVRRNGDMLCTIRVANRRSRRRSDELSRIAEELEGICCIRSTGRALYREWEATGTEHRWAVVQIQFCRKSM